MAPVTKRARSEASEAITQAQFVMADHDELVDLVEFARRQAAGHPTLRTILTIGAPDGVGDDVNRVEALGSGIAPAEARARIAAIQAGDTEAKWLAAALRAAGVLKEGESL